MSGKHIVLGILAHVDAGKTTLSESLLYLSGSIRKIGRVDHGDTFLDTDSLEKQRGITIFSKQAQLSFSAGSLFSGRDTDTSDVPRSLDVTLLDTPGHADFSPEMERTLSVLDYALLVISAPDGVTGQVRTLWKLLEHYEVPTVIFVNKMDQPGMDKSLVLSELTSNLSSHCVPLPDRVPEDFEDEAEEDLCICDDGLLERYLETGSRAQAADISNLIDARKLFPVFFGSALKNEGIEALARGLVRYTEEPRWPEHFCAKVFKISRDPSGTRLAWVRVLGGCMKAKSEVKIGVSGSEDGLICKIDQIRQYSGSTFATLREAPAGQIVCVAGLKDVMAGQMLGDADDSDTAWLPKELPKDLREEFPKDLPKNSPEEFPEGIPSGKAAALLARASRENLVLPVFRSSIIPEDGTDPVTALKNLRILEEEEPMLRIQYDQTSREISAEIMGEVETEIIRDLCQKRFGMKIAFGPPSIVYRETIAAPVEGVGHYEPLRHYSEVHLLLEPAARGSGVTFDAQVSTDDLALNWQRLILSSLMSVKFRGVLTGSEITDMKVTLIGGRASEKHTEGGDFRQASVRALRQGLMSAESILLEPWYSFSASLPQEHIGRLMADVQRMEGRLDPVAGDGNAALLTGSLPAAEAGSYAATVRAYTHGTGQITFSLKGYEPCRHPEEVILAKGYDPAADLDQPADSVFCSHGAGVIVPWDQVRGHMHVDTGWRPEGTHEEDDSDNPQSFSSDWRKDQTKRKKTWQEEQREIAAGEDELRRIFEKTYKGSSWNTALHNSMNDDISDDTGIWSRDGSLERGAEKSDAEVSRPADQKKINNAKETAREDYLLVDGYNIIFAWPELRELVSTNLDSAAGRLVEILSDFQGTQRGRMIIVFDAYKVHGGKRHIIHQGNVDIIYTKEAETADAYIMELTHTLAKKGNVTVATGDGIVQMIIFSAGARRMSAAELKDRVDSAKKGIREKYHI